MFFLSDVKFVSHYSPPIAYKKQGVVSYDFAIDEEAHLGSKTTKNNYTQTVSLNLNYTSNNLYHFDVKTANRRFNLETALTQQGKLLEYLSELTENISIGVSEKGIITSFESKALQKQWETMRPRLIEMYRSSQAKAYLSDLDRCISKEGFLLQQLRQPYLYGLLFDRLQAAHEKDRPRKRTIHNFVYGIPFSFEERVLEVREENQKRYITIEGSMQDLAQEDMSRISQYFKRYGITETKSWSVKYHKNIVLDTSNGYLDRVDFELEVSNDNGYTQRRTYTLNKQING